MIKDYRLKVKGLPDLLNYCMFITEGVLLLKDGALCAAFSYRGPDLNSATQDDIQHLARQCHSTLSLLGNGWMLHADLIRKESSGYVASEQCHFNSDIRYHIDCERREYYSNRNQHFESQTIWVFTYRPPEEIQTRFKRLFITKKTRGEKSCDTVLHFFLEKIKEIEYSLQRLLVVQQLTSEQLFNHIYTCLTDQHLRLRIPAGAVFVDYFLGHLDFVGGMYPMVNDKHVRVISLMGFPLESFTGFLQSLEHLPLSFRWSNRFIFLDQEQACTVIKDYRRNWFAKRHSLLGLLREAMFPQGSGGVLNQDALDMTDDAEAALAEATSGLVRYGFYTSVIILQSHEQGIVDEAAQLVIKQLQDCGFVGKVETINAVEALLGSLPGHGYQNIRKPVIHTLNLADFLPLTSVWAGLETNACRYYKNYTAPLFYAATDGATPFRFHLHVQDVGHTLIIGDTGSGKSTLVGLMAAQHARFPGAQVFIFDKGYSAYILCKAVNGQHYDLGHPEQPLCFCPLGAIDDAEQFARAFEWILLVVSLQGITLTMEQRAECQRALLQLREQPSRSLTDFQSTLQDKTLKAAFEYYTLSGPLGEMLDGTHDSFAMSSFQVFEMTHLFERNALAVLPVLAYIFNQIESRLTGAPTMIIIEEGHRFLNGAFGERLELWLRELRKKNAAVIFVTQQLTEVMQSQIKNVLLNSCKTRIFLPNHHAADPINRALYLDAGLTTRQIELINYATPKKHYFYTSPLGCRLIDLNLGPLALSLIGVDSQADRNCVDELMVLEPDTWLVRWLQRRGLMQWAQIVQEQQAIQDKETECE